MPRFLGFLLVSSFTFFFPSCWKKVTPKSEISRGVPNSDPAIPVIEFGEEQNLYSPSGSPLAGNLGTADLLIPRDASDQAFSDPSNTIRPFDPVYFDFDQYIMKQEERKKVIGIATFLQQNQNARLLIEGYCDWKGTPSYNKALGERRANSVKEYLIELGTDPDRIDTLSIGDELAIPEAFAFQSKIDRRAEFVISKTN